MSLSIENLVNKFEIKGGVLGFEAIKSGHINDTYRIFNNIKGNRDYILQRINHHIFKNVPKLQENILRVTSHIKLKLNLIKSSDVDRHVLTLIPASNGNFFYQDIEGNFWRMMHFIEDSHSFDSLSSPELACKAGQAFGGFSALLSDLPGEPLYETICDFHNMEWRLQQFHDAIKENYGERLDLVKEEIGWVEERKEEMLKINRLGREGKLPKRNIHCDTKINNILFDKNDNPLCIIDLDTVMPGYITSDFGDAIRTGANTGAEDDPDLSKVSMSLDLFKGFTAGYITGAASFLTKNEIENLAFSARLFAYMQSVRFLADFIDGDRYYKVRDQMHNLQRARAQFKLLFSMEDQYDQMLKIIHEVAKEKCPNYA